MASTLIITMAKPFTSHSTNLPSLSNQRLLGGRRNSLRVSAIAKKFEPTKVIPQADRVLIRLEELPEKSAGGVLLPKSAVKFERYLMGEILSVGAEVEQVEAGKKVLFSDVSAYEIRRDPEEAIDAIDRCRESDRREIQRKRETRARRKARARDARERDEREREGLTDGGRQASQSRGHGWRSTGERERDLRWSTDRRVDWIEDQVDLGTDGRHCFCKAGDLLAVVE